MDAKGKWLVIVILLGVVGRVCGGDLGRMIYWTDKDAVKIQSARLDGSVAEDILTGADGLANPRGLSMDLRAGKLYWVDSGTRSVYRGETDGSDIELLYNNLSFPADMALDLIQRKIYWADTGTLKIQRANMDGTGPIEDIVSGVGQPYYIELDEINNVIYWSDLQNTYIRRMSLDGGGLVENVVVGLSHVRDIALDIGEGKIYWGDRGSSKVQRMNLDGTGGIEDLFVEWEGLDRPHGLALDFDARKVYWTDTRTHAIHRGNMDGSGSVETFMSGLVGPWALVIVPTTPDFDQDGDVDGADYGVLADWWGYPWCGRQNGWCGGVDLGADGVIGFDDIADFVGMWLVEED